MGGWDARPGGPACSALPAAGWGHCSNRRAGTGATRRRWAHRPRLRRGAPRRQDGHAGERFAWEALRAVRWRWAALAVLLAGVGALTVSQWHQRPALAAAWEQHAAALREHAASLREQLAHQRCAARAPARAVCGRGLGCRLPHCLREWLALQRSARWACSRLRRCPAVFLSRARLLRAAAAPRPVSCPSRH